MSSKLLVVGCNSSHLTNQFYCNISSILLDRVPKSSLLVTDISDCVSSAELLSCPNLALRAATVSLRSSQEPFVVVKGFFDPPTPSFDVLGWNLQLAANAGLSVVYVTDGIKSHLLQQDIVSFCERAKLHDATVAGVIVLGEENVTYPQIVDCPPIFGSPFTENKISELLATPATALTPIGFQTELLFRAAAKRKRIVLPESEDPRILEATTELLSKGVADIVLLGNETEIAATAKKHGVNLQGAQTVDIRDTTFVSKYAEELQRIRSHKGMTLQEAEELVSTPTYFGTMMVQMGDADGMVSGATHTTADTIRPAFQIIKTAPNMNLVSSSFLMLMPTHPLVFADCAVTVSPDAKQLSEIAVSSADTARQFGIDPKVAMLSYSTLGSGKGASVQTVTEATELVNQVAPDLPVVGPIQYDASVDPSVGSQKAPGSPVAGKATVLVFPDLNAGNIAYKAIQRSAGAVAVGPLLQGLRKPVNDLSRGATVEDIVNTVAITAIQAGANK